jgi:small subunit ribosomal protein S3
MGHKTHPVGFRLGIIKDWQGRWFAGKGNDYRRILLEDIRIRKTLQEKYTDAGVGRIEIERNAQEVEVTIWTSRPGIVIGRQGQRVEETRKALQAVAESKIRLSVQEIRTPELDAALVARNVAEQLERRVAHRRAILQASSRTMQAGAEGVKIIVKGRLGGAEIARREKVMIGRVPLHTIRADVDFAISEAHTMMGRIGVKAWIYKGNIIPDREKLDIEEIPSIEVNVRAEESAEEGQSIGFQQEIFEIKTEEVEDATTQES